MSVPPVDSPNCFERFFAHPRVKLACCILEKISLIALAAFAAYTCPKLFFPFFGAGIILGTGLYWGKTIQWPWLEKKQASCCQQPNQPCAEEQQPAAGFGGCGGFLEQLTNSPLPPPFGLFVNIGITVGHIGHHSTIFVPIVGLNAGVWVGRIIGGTAPLLIQAIADRCAPSTPAPTSETVATV